MSGGDSAEKTYGTRMRYPHKGRILRLMDTKSDAYDQVPRR